jgi:flavin-dependent dehydrogenase
MKRYDAIVIGAGPAGAATALFLLKSGFEVLLLDQARFPRDKVCGEFISPAADPLFAELGVLDEIERLPPRRLRGVAISAYGGPELCIDYPQWKGRAVTSLSLRRTVLDHLLVKKIRSEGLLLREGCRVHNLIFGGGAVVGVEGVDEHGIAFDWRARVVIDAGGRNAVSPRLLNLKENRSRSTKVALAAHWRGATLPADYCYMHVSAPGYTGAATVDDGTVNVVLVVDSAQLQGKDPTTFYIESVMSNPRRALLFAGGTLGEKPRAVESLAFTVQPPACDGLLLVGDAMGFIDPFTGEGIYLALRSARLAADAMTKALRRDGVFIVRDCLEYEARRRTEFDGKFRLSRILQKIIYSPVVARRVVAALERRSDLAQTLVGVIGDYLPADEVLSLNFLSKLLFSAMRTL